MYFESFIAIPLPIMIIVLALVISYYVDNAAEEVWV